MPGPSAALLRPMNFAAVIFLVAAGLLGYRVARDSVTANIYKARLTELQQDYDALTTRYNDAVTRAAVTELLVKNGGVNIVVRSTDGVLQTIETPYNAANEVFIDYAVLDGKLWIRRVFDEDTPPNQGTLIDPELAKIDWDDTRAQHGKIAYRSLADGRWVVSVSGDGSVGLRQVSEQSEVALVNKPAVRDFDPVQQAEADAQKIGVGDVLGHFFGGATTE